MAHDYVIVGAGSAGCVLANRLSARSDRRVLLLEAGPSDRHPNVGIPAGFAKLFKSARDWAYESEPQPGADGRSFFLPRGKTLGGSSSINAMLYLRGHRADYDEWARRSSAEWSYDNVLPYFKRSEDQQDFLDAHHGVGGPLTVSNQHSPRSPSLAFVEAAAEVGFPRNPDFNGAVQDGFGLFQVTQRRGARASTARTFLAAARGRPNLEVITGAHVLRLQFAGRRVIRVIYETAGVERSADVGGEVILAAGAFNSPQLLMLSGIGDGEALRRLGIEVVVDRPAVGRNLEDHVYAPLTFRCGVDATLDTAEHPRHLLGNLLAYLLARRGPFTSPVAEAGGFVRTRPELVAPDIQFHFAPVFFLDHGFTVPGGNGLTLGPTLLQPHSRGEVRLRSADPRQAPLIDPRFLSDERDVETLVAGLRIAWRIAAAQSLAAFRLTPYRPASELASDAEVAAFVRAELNHLYHPVGTCRMGNDDDAVVDPELRLRGVENLRVADASIMPRIPRGNTNAPTIMVAEKAADLLLATGR